MTRKLSTAALRRALKEADCGGYIGEALAEERDKLKRQLKRRTKQRSEASVKKAVADWLRAFGYRFFRMQSGQILGQHKGRPWMMRLCPPGTPDFIVLERIPFATRVTWLEVKRPLGPKGGTGGSEQSEDQIAFQAEAGRHGERYAVVRGVDDLMLVFGIGVNAQG